MQRRQVSGWISRQSHISKFASGSSAPKYLVKANCDECDKEMQAHEHRNTLSMHTPDGEQRAFYAICDDCYPAMRDMMLEKLQ